MIADAAGAPLVVTAEDGVRVGGAGSAMADAIGRAAAEAGTRAPRVVVLGVPDEYLAQGPPAKIHANLGLDGPGIAASVLGALEAATVSPRPLTVRLRARAAVAAMVALALLGGACGGGGDDDDDKAKVATKGSTTSTVAGATTTTAPGDPGATTTTVAAGSDTTVGGGPGTTAAPGPAVTAPPATAPPGPVALTPAAPGVYHYVTAGGVTFNGSPVSFPPDTTNTIGAPAGSRQLATRDLRNGADGLQVAYTFDYRPDGLYLVSLVFTTSYLGTPYPLALTPATPTLFLATGATTGASQTLNIPTSGGTANVVVDVLGTEPVAVGGQTVDTLIVRSVATLPPGQIAGSQSLVINLDRASRLWVRERAVGDATGSISGFTVSVHTEYTATLKSLTPG